MPLSELLRSGKDCAKSRRERWGKDNWVPSMKEPVLAHLDSSHGHLGELECASLCRSSANSIPEKPRGWPLASSPLHSILWFHSVSIMWWCQWPPSRWLSHLSQRLSQHLEDSWRLGWSPFTGNLKQVPGSASFKRCTHGMICLSLDGESQPGPWKSGHLLPSSTHIESPSLLLPLKLSLSWLQPSLVTHTHRALSIHNTFDHPSQTL